MAVEPDPASIRDPGGCVFRDAGRILRAVYSRNTANYEAARDAGLYHDFVNRNWLLPLLEIDAESSPAGNGASYLLEHPRLPFVSYPYEWPFSLHKKAALLQLDLMLEALEQGFTLSDASAYNVQFYGCEPRFIDHLSFVRYQDGEIWNGHRQFCMQYLNPLIMWAKLGVAPNSWFRGSLDGIPPEHLSPLMRWRDLSSGTIIGHVLAQNAAQRRTGYGSPVAAKKRQLPRTSFKAMLVQLRDFISGLRYPGAATIWRGYDADNSYGDVAAETKRNFIRSFVTKTRPDLLIDLGCNSGEYSAVAIEAGARQVVGFDFDFGALERAIERSENDDLALLPLWLDATNPSPSQGWNQTERSGLDLRAKGDAVLGLALVHHLAIARNIPLKLVINWIMSLAPVGVIEFTPKSDAMVQMLLSHREDIFPDYCEEHFLEAVASHGQIVASERVAPLDRLLVWYAR